MGYVLIILYGIIIYLYIDILDGICFDYPIWDNYIYLYIDILYGICFDYPIWDNYISLYRYLIWDMF